MDVVLADDDFLNAEFPAIIAAQWPVAEPPEPARHERDHYQSRAGAPFDGAEHAARDPNDQEPKPGPGSALRLLRNP